MDGLEDRKVRIERMWTAAWNHGRLERFDDVLAPEYVRRTSGASRAHGLATLKELIRETRRGFPDTRTAIDQILVDGDHVAIRWHSTGTHRGVYRGVPPTGRVVTLEGATFARFQGEQMVETWSTWDPAAMLRALGVLTLEGVEHVDE